MDPTSKMADTTNLLVHDTDEDITLEVHNLSEEWTLNTDLKEVLRFEEVWHSMHPHCTLIIKPKKSHVREIIFDIHAYQTGNENNRATLKIAEQIQQSLSPLSCPEDDPVESLIRELIILLDPANIASTDSGDWKDLASKMGHGMAKIRWLSTQNQSSPTRILLEKWLEDKHELSDLEQMMRDINRPDAADVVQTVINEMNQ